MSHFNAILIGGPPHSGKSVLTYSLTNALRDLQVEHYVVRACPDGEGDWSNEAHPDTVKLIRQKGRFTPDFVEQVCVDLGRRHLPLLVDAGGKPQPDQETIFAQCTHAILIARDEAGLSPWRELARRNGLNVIAELISDLQAPAVLVDEGEPLRARLNGLERHQMPDGPVFAAVIDRVATYLFEPPAALRRRHMDSAPVELAVDLQDLAQQLHVSDESNRWLPEHLPLVLAYLPSAVNVGLYGRGPNWLYAAVALHAAAAEFFLFDARLAWVTPAEVTLTPSAPVGPLLFTILDGADHTRLEITASDYYLDYTECRRIEAPALSPEKGVLLSGKIPHWLMCGLARAYRDHPWLAVYQPQLGNYAVVVWTQEYALRLGELVAVDRVGE